MRTFDWHFFQLLLLLKLLSFVRGLVKIDIQNVFRCLLNFKQWLHFILQNRTNDARCHRCIQGLRPAYSTGN